MSSYGEPGKDDEGYEPSSESWLSDLIVDPSGPSRDSGSPYSSRRTCFDARRCVSFKGTFMKNDLRNVSRTDDSSCDDHEEKKVPFVQPLNPFILYCAERRTALTERLRGSHTSHDITRELARMWKALDKNEKLRYKQLWLERKEEFHRRYPGMVVPRPGRQAHNKKDKEGVGKDNADGEEAEGSPRPRRKSAKRMSSERSPKKRKQNKLNRPRRPDGAQPHVPEAVNRHPRSKIGPYSTADVDADLAESSASPAGMKLDVDRMFSPQRVISSPPSSPDSRCSSSSHLHAHAAGRQTLSLPSLSSALAQLADGSRRRTLDEHVTSQLQSHSIHSPLLPAAPTSPRMACESPFVVPVFASSCSRLPSGRPDGASACGVLPPRSLCKSLSDLPRAFAAPRLQRFSSTSPRLAPATSLPPLQSASPRDMWSPDSPHSVGTTPRSSKKLRPYSAAQVDTVFSLPFDPSFACPPSALSHYVALHRRPPTPPSKVSAPDTTHPQASSTGRLEYASAMNRPPETLAPSATAAG